METAAPGDTVLVHFTARTEDGEVVETSRDRDPDRVTLGEGDINPAFEEALIGMAPGEETEVHLPAEDAYGPRHQNLVFTVKRSRVSGEETPVPGALVRITLPTGGEGYATVRKVGPRRLLLDANHPLAGEDLTYRLTLVAIIDD